MRQPDTMILMNECANKGCRRRPVVARKIGDFWVTHCERCISKTITIDFERIAAVYGKTAHLKARTAA